MYFQKRHKNYSVTATVISNVSHLNSVAEIINVRKACVFFLTVFPRFLWQFLVGYISKVIIIQ